MVESRKRPKRKMKRVILACTAAVAVIGAGLIGYHVYANSQSFESATTFRKVTAAKGSIHTTVSGSGSVSDAAQLTLTAANAGTADSIPVKQGDSVKAGQTIAHVGGTASAQNVLQKQNSLASAKNQLTQAQQNLDALYVKAPAAGKVKSVTASSGDNLSTIKPLGDLAALSTSRSMTVSFNSSQSVKAGQAVTVVDTDANSSYSGTVTSTSGPGGAKQQNENTSGSVVATIGTDDPKVGDSATVRLDGTAIGSGTLQLEKSIPIANSGSGVISNVYVSENQTVDKGQNLFKLDSSSADQQISTAQASVTAAQNDLENVQASAQKDTVTSPVNGVVAELDVKNGDSVASGATVAVVIDPNDMQTVLSVDELDISSVAAGQKATVTLDAVPGKTFDGTVTQVDPIGTNSNGVATYNVTVSIANPDGIKVGMTTNADIITKSVNDVTVVPASAVLEKNGNKGYVLPAEKLFDESGKSIRLQGMTTSELVRTYGRQVTIGMATADQDEITGGVSSGDSLAVAITINQAAVKSLSNTDHNNNQNQPNGFSGMRGFSGMTGGNTNRTGKNKAGGAGNTVAKDNNGNNGQTTAGINTTGNKSGGTGTAKGNGAAAGGTNNGSGGAGTTGGTGTANNGNGTTGGKSGN